MTKKERRLCRHLDKVLGLTVGTHELLCAKYKDEGKNAIIKVAKKEARK